MAIFQYSGFDSSGNEINGIIEADSEDSAKNKLKENSCFVSSIVEFAEKGQKIQNYSGRVSFQEVTYFTRQFASLLEASLSVVEALDTLIEQQENESFRFALISIRDSVKGGNTLSGSLSKFPDYFSVYYINMIKAAEASGTLDSVMLTLSTYMEKQLGLRVKIKAILAYPLFMGIISIGTVAFLLTVIVPNITKIFKDFNHNLPLVTKILIETSTFLITNIFFIIGGLIFAYWAFKNFSKSEKGGKWIDGLKLGFPLFKIIYRKIMIIQFTSTFSALLRSGYPFIESLQVVKHVVSNRSVHEVIDRLCTSVRDGAGLAVSMKKEKVFDPMVVHMVMAGEKAGNLDFMLNKISQIYENELEADIMSATSMIEPILIVVMGGIIGFVVLAIILPIFEMNQVIG